MIQVQYRWRLKPGSEATFEQAWLRATVAIKATRKGSHGSMLLRASDDKAQMMATAFWDSHSIWTAARQLGPAHPEAAARMASCAELVSTEFFELRRDEFTT